MIPSGVEIYVGLEPIDLRWGFDRLSGLVEERIGRAARSGALFVFFGMRKSALKILFYDGSGLCQFYKRLDRHVCSVFQKARSQTVRLSSSANASLTSCSTGSRWTCRSRDIGNEGHGSTGNSSGLRKKSLDAAIRCVMSRSVSDERSQSGDMHRVELAVQLAASPELLAVLQAERAAFAAERATFAQRVAELEKERDNLRVSHERLRQELELFKRRLFIAKAERIDTEQLELEFAEKLRKLDELAGTLGISKQAPDTHNGDGSDGKTHHEGDNAADGKRRGKRKTTAARVGATCAICPSKKNASRSRTRTWRNSSKRARSFVMASTRLPSSRTSAAASGA
jgi:hypothetical protein